MGYPSVRTFLRGRVGIAWRRKPGVRNMGNIKRELVAYLQEKDTYLRSTARGPVSTPVDKERAKISATVFYRLRKDLEEKLGVENA